MNPNELIEYPVDKDNETLIIANLIKSKENRDFFVRQGNSKNFRYKEFETIAWSVVEIETNKLELNIDAILLKSKSSPIKYLVTFEFIQEIIDNFNEVPLVNFREHNEKLVTDFVKSQMLDKIFSSLFKVCTNPVSKLSDVENRLDYLKSIVETGFSASKLEFQGMDTIIPQYIKDRELNREKYTTGFSQIDALLMEGFAPKQITTVAGLAGSGKSSWNLSSMKNLANRKIVAAQFALEMNNFPLVHKLLAFNTRFPMSKIITNIDQMLPEERAFYNAELIRLERNKKLFFNDKSTQTLDTIREQIMLLQDHLKTEYMVVSIDLFTKIQEFQSSDNFARDTEKNANKVQKMAKELGVHLVLVAQIKRDVANRKFSRPSMQDVKNSGALAEISDIMLGIYRPYYNPEIALKAKVAQSIIKQGNLFTDPDMDDDFGNSIEKDPDENIAEIIIMKQRMGENNTLVNLFFNPDTTCFESIEEEYQRVINARKKDLAME